MRRVLSGGKRVMERRERTFLNLTSGRGWAPRAHNDPRVRGLPGMFNRSRGPLWACREPEQWRTKMVNSRPRKYFSALVRLGARRCEISFTPRNYENDYYNWLFKYRKMDFRECARHKLVTRESIGIVGFCTNCA